MLNLQRFTESSVAVSPAAEPELAKAPAMAAEYDYEIVLGRAHFAGIGLAAIVLVAVFSGVAYSIGKSMASTAVVDATPALAVPLPEPPTPAPAAPAPISAQEQTKTPAAPLFGDEVTGKVYLQVGAIEKGLAAIWAEGLRTHGLDAFVAPGPGDKQWRVVIGPLPDSQAFQRAKDTLDRLQVNTFGRRYQP